MSVAYGADWGESTIHRQRTQLGVETGSSSILDSSPEL